MYKLVLALRYLLRKWIAVFAVLSVWLCVAMVLIVFSVMDGFLDNIKQHSRGLLSDIIIDNATLQGFPYYEEFAAHLRDKLPDTVARVTPVIYNYGILRVAENNSNFTKPVRVVGIRLEEYEQVNTFRDSLHYEKYYPGTTTLGPMLKPVAGLAEAALAGETISPAQCRLPPEYDAAWERYRAAHPADKSLAELKPYVSLPQGYASPHGVGVFDLDVGPPGYVDDPLPGIIIGTDLIYQRKADGSYNRVIPRGGKIILTILPLTVRGSLAEDPIPVAMRHVDDSRTKVYEIDNICAYVDFAMIQKLLSMGPLERVDGSMTPARTSQLLVRLVDGVEVNAGRAKIAEVWDAFVLSLADRLTVDDANLLGIVGIETWEQRQVQFIAAVEKEKVLVTALFGIISIVAIVLIGVIFHMIVLQKTRDIGIIKSIGATRAGVAAVFLMYGAAVGVVGGILGVISGSVFVHYINDIQDLLAQFNPNLRVWSPDVYTFDRIPNVVKPEAMVSVFVMAVLTAILGALVPALKAASVWPVTALRYE